jgi:hypothetical protein
LILENDLEKRETEISEKNLPDSVGSAGSPDGENQKFV